MKLTGNRNQCQVCKQYFNSSNAFTKHRTGDFNNRRCRTPDEMRAMGMVLPDHGFWVTKLNHWRDYANAIHNQNRGADRDSVPASEA